MGGKAIKSIELKRLSDKDYFVLIKKVESKLKICFPERQIKLIPAYKTKKDFGDADFLISSSDVTENIRSVILDNFNPVEISKNSNVWSFDFEFFQIDIILVIDKYFESSYNYYSHSDLGNLIGKLFHKFGLKYGHDGLKYVFRDGTNEIGNIELSLDTNEILNFIGLDVARYNQGFDSLEDIFKFVSSSEYFNPDIYLLDNLNHTARVRDRKRKTYQEFLKWCEIHKNELNHYQWNPEKSVYFERIQSFFPHFYQKIEELNAKRELNRQRRAKFNGDIVKNLTLLEASALGEFIRKFKNSKPDWNSYLDSSTEQDIIQDIRNFKI